MRRSYFNSLKYVFVALTVLLLLSVGSAFFLLNYALTPSHDGRNVEQSWQDMYRTYPDVKNWSDSLRHCKALRDTFITAPDGIRLHAYYVRAARPTRRTAVIVHGYTDNAVRMMMIGRMYGHDLGYNILLPDLRRAGQSDGSHIQMGWLDRLDVARWVSSVPRLFGDTATVVVHGISMGAATTMMLSGDSQPQYVRAFVEDCGYTDVKAQFTKEISERFHLPFFPLIPLASALCRLRYGWSFDEASALKQVSRCRLPMLFIHGSADTYVPTSMVNELYAAKPAPKALWVAPGSAHAMSYHDYPQEYTSHVAWFLRSLM